MRGRAAGGGSLATTGTFDTAPTVSLTLASLSTLDWTIAKGGPVTAAERFGGNAAIDAGASLTFGQTANASYAGELSGAGSFRKVGSGSLDLTGNSSAFTGATSGLAFLDALLSYDANNVFLTLTRNDLSFAGVG